MRDSVLRRPRYTNDELAWFCGLAARHGIKVTLYVLVGLPDETVADFMETVRMTRRCRPDKIFLSIFYPYPGTDLYRLALERGYFEPGKIDGSAERSRAVLDLPGFSRRRIYLEYLLFYARVYHGIWSWKDIALHTARMFIRGFPSLHSLVKGIFNGNRVPPSPLGRDKLVHASKD